MARWEDMVTVGRVGRPHGLRGHVVVNPETDFVEERFAPGQAVHVQRAGQVQPLAVASLRIQGGRPVVRFEGMDRIEDVEPFVGCELRIPEESLAPLEPGRYYHHQLVGCVVDTVDGTRVGEVTAVEGGEGCSRLVIRGARGDVLVPLATDIVPTIDVAARRIVVAPPEGLLDVNEMPGTGGRRRRT